MRADREGERLLPDRRGAGTPPILELEQFMGYRTAFYRRGLKACISGGLIYATSFFLVAMGGWWIKEGIRESHQSANAGASRVSSGEAIRTSVLLCVVFVAMGVSIGVMAHRSSFPLWNRGAPPAPVPAGGAGPGNLAAPGGMMLRRRAIHSTDASRDSTPISSVVTSPRV